MYNLDYIIIYKWDQTFTAVYHRLTIFRQCIIWCNGCPKKENKMHWRCSGVLTSVQWSALAAMHQPLAGGRLQTYIYVLYVLFNPSPTNPIVVNHLSAMATLADIPRWHRSNRMWKKFQVEKRWRVNDHLVYMNCFSSLIVCIIQIFIPTFVYLYR